jgi:hypothetical protein
MASSKEPPSAAADSRERKLAAILRTRVMEALRRAGLE